jgi:hypothetical protein
LKKKKVSLTTQEAEIWRIKTQNQPRQIALETLSQKHSTQNKAGRVTKVVQHLLRKHKALSSNSSITKKKKKKQAESEGSGVQGQPRQSY